MLCAPVASKRQGVLYPGKREKPPAAKAFTRTPEVNRRSIGSGFIDRLEDKIVEEDSEDIKEGDAKCGKRSQRVELGVFTCVLPCVFTGELTGVFNIILSASTSAQMSPFCILGRIPWLFSWPTGSSLAKGNVSPDATTLFLFGTVRDTLCVGGRRGEIITIPSQ